jgi:hypothetical protein
MVVDYDLSKVATDQAESWICLQAEVICGQIRAAQLARMGFPLVYSDRIGCAIPPKQPPIFPTLSEGRA